MTKGRKEIRTFATMTDELLQLGDWLSSVNCTHVAIESTGVYWKPVFNILEGLLTVILVNARHIKAVPGRKTDVRDCDHLTENREAELTVTLSQHEENYNEHEKMFTERYDLLTGAF